MEDKQEKAANLSDAEIRKEEESVAAANRVRESAEFLQYWLCAFLAEVRRACG